MADTKISGLTALAGASVASGDLAVVVDISDTTMAATGTDKRLTIAALGAALTALGLVDSTTVILAPASSVRNVIQATGDFTELTLEANPAQTEHILKVHDNNGDLAVNVDAFGILDTRVLSVGNPPDDPAPGTSTTGVVPGGVQVQKVRADSNPAYVITDPNTNIGFFHINAAGKGRLFELQGIEPTDVLAQFGAALTQTAALQEMWNYPFDTRLMAVLANGGITSNAHAAPADADLDNSSFSLWLDDTPGATKLKVKAKDSSGTVRTATIPLA